MTQQFRGKLRFFTSKEGSRWPENLPLPTGPRFATTAVPFLPSEGRPPGWPWSGPQFTVILEMDSPGSYEWAGVSVSAFAPDGPEASALRPGARLMVLEGPHPLADLTIDD